MYISFSRCRKTFIALLLLWATGLLGWGNPILAVAETTVQVPRPISQTEQENTLEKSNRLNLTTAQQQWLDKELQKCNSHKKQFSKILPHINHRDSFIRLAAYKGLCRLLIDHTELANKKAMQHVKSVLKKIGAQAEAQEALHLLDALVNANPKLALSAAKMVAHLTKASQQPKTDEEACINQKVLRLLIPTIIKNSSDGVPYLINKIHKHTRMADGNYITSSSGITISGLNVAEQLLQIDVVHNNPQYLNQVLEIILDGASLHDLVWGTSPFKNPTVQAHAQTLLRKVVQQYPAVVKGKCETLTKQAREDVPDVVALVYLTAFATVDYQCTVPLLVLFNDILEATNTRIQILTDKQCSEEKMHGASKGLTGLVSGALTNKAFESAEKKLIRENIELQDDSVVRVPLLRLLREITTYNKSYLPEGFTIIRKMLDKNEKSNIIRVEALDTLTHIVTWDSSYRSEATLIVSHCTEEKSTHVRKSAFQLLQVIIKSDEKYATDATALNSLNKFKQDRDTQIRKRAKELFSEYIPIVP